MLSVTFVQVPGIRFDADREGSVKMDGWFSMSKFERRGNLLGIVADFQVPQLSCRFLNIRNIEESQDLVVFRTEYRDYQMRNRHSPLWHTQHSDTRDCLLSSGLRQLESACPCVVNTLISTSARPKQGRGGVGWLVGWLVALAQFVTW